MIKIAVINGSVQERNYTGFALRIIKKEIENNENYSIVEINLKDFNLPFPGEKIENDDSPKLQELLRSADAYILGTPEYNGTFTAKLKLMIENSGYPAPMKGKPISLIGVASGILGAIKSLEHLRSVCSHIGGFILPRVVSVAEVDKKFDETGNCIEPDTDSEIKIIVTNFIKFFNQIKN